MTRKKVNEKEEKEKLQKAITRTADDVNGADESGTTDGDTVSSDGDTIDPRIATIITLRKKDKLAEKVKQERIYSAMSGIQTVRS